MNFKKTFTAALALTIMASASLAPVTDNKASLFASSTITVSAKESTKVITEADMDAFFKKWNGKNVNSDSVAPNQCVDLIARYMTDVMGISEAKATFHAYNYCYFYGDGVKEHAFLKENFYKLDNTPDFVPQKGDIFVRVTGNYGHVGIVADNKATTKNFNAYEQNTTDHQDPVQLINNNYNGVSCFLRYKKIEKLPSSTEKKPAFGTVWVEGDKYYFKSAAQMYTDKTGKTKAGTIAKGESKTIQRFLSSNNGKDTIGVIDSKHYVLVRKNNVLLVNAHVTTNYKSGVNLRSAPNTDNSKVYGVIPNGTRLPVIACNGSWILTTYGVKTGYVNLGICKE